MRRHHVTTLAVMAAAAILLTGCAQSPSDSPSGVTETAGSFEEIPTASGEITVFAAASLTEAFEELGTKFEQANPSATITLNFGPSSGLATQITEGAPADVFASASGTTMDAVVAAKAAEAPTPFAANLLEIAVPPDNPAKITALADLANPDVKVALCQVDVPCGKIAATVLDKADLTVKPVTLEADVKATLTKVELGEVDAGLVYVTDVQAAGDKVTGIEIPADQNASTSYPIAALTATKNPDLAKAFVDFVLSADGAKVLTAAGFQKP